MNTDIKFLLRLLNYCDGFDADRADYPERLSGQKSIIALGELQEDIYLVSIRCDAIP